MMTVQLTSLFEKTKPLDFVGHLFARQHILQEVNPDANYFFNDTITCTIPYTSHILSY